MWLIPFPQVTTSSHPHSISSHLPHMRKPIISWYVIDKPILHIAFVFFITDVTHFHISEQRTSINIIYTHTHRGSEADVSLFSSVWCRRRRASTPEDSNSTFPHRRVRSFPVFWRDHPSVASAGGWRMEGRPHFKASADVRLWSDLYIYIYHGYRHLWKSFHFHRCDSFHFVHSFSLLLPTLEEGGTPFLQMWLITRRRSFQKKASTLIIMADQINRSL